jgi:hypothetical protein
LTTSTRQTKKGVRFYAHPYKATAPVAET